MNELLTLQDQFQGFLLSDNQDIKTSIIQTKTVSVEKRLSIYKDAYSLRLIECLTSNYPALSAFLGAEAFHSLCESYIHKHPSSFRSIRWYGHDLCDFIKHEGIEDALLLAELADFEWKMTLAFDASDDVVLPLEEMATIPGEAWPGMQFILHASVQRANYFYNVVDLWQALLKGDTLPKINCSDKALSWFLWRSSDYLIKYCSISDIEAWALDAVMQGLSFGEVCEGLCQWVAIDEVGMRAASFLKSWIQRGIVSQLLLIN